MMMGWLHPELEAAERPDGAAGGEGEGVTSGAAVGDERHVAPAAAS